MAIAIHSNLNSLLLKHGKKHSKTHPHVPQRSSNLTIIKAVQGRQLIESGIIQAITPNEAATALKSGDGGFKLLDVRPEWEWRKARVPGSIHVPLFLEDVDNSPLTLLKKWVHFGYIGLWTGQKFTTMNEDFVKQVQGFVPDKDSMLLVACGEGLR